jgi:acetylornithine deacetylase/succinyl-diaminopimelate desuccinylase-like protein
MTPSANIKLLFEGEEEMGSPHLQSYFARNKDDLAADAWLLCDGPVHQSGRPQLYFGARGNITVEVTVYGPNRPLHSGHYGNWSPNPIADLAHLMASLRDNDGRVLIDGWREDVRSPTPAELAMIAGLPHPDDQLREELALGRSEGEGRRLAELLLEPALNFRGIASGAVGAHASNTIQTEATVSIDFRLVPSQTPVRVREVLEAHLSRHGWHVVARTPDQATRSTHRRLVKLEWGDGYPAARTSVEARFSIQLVATIKAVTGQDPILMPTAGGSVPMYLFGGEGERPVAILPIANHDNNQHGANENLRLQNLWDGIEIYAGVMARGRDLSAE